MCRLDKRLILVFAVVTASIGGVIAWRVTQPPKPVVPPVQDLEARSLVLLLDRPPNLDKLAISKAVATEFGAQAHVTGDLPSLTVLVDGNELSLRVRQDEYPLRDFNDFEMKHFGWIGVDHSSWKNRPEVDSYPPMARVLAALWPEGAAAIVCPESKEWAIVTRSTPKKLREPNVLDALFRPDKTSGLKNMHIDDSDFAAARAEARRRWPEFVRAFRAHEGKAFIVKASVTRGKFTEHIWIDVVSEHEGAITGRLANEPFELEGLKLGSTVSISAGDIDDWRFVFDGEIHGYFTQAAVKARQ
ncbi:MAG: DUF2314 domain-containing protein [Acidobacteria bacterium]|nr:DUF2314 domain-containing protein [Acidobacteriota bacterium]